MDISVTPFEGTTFGATITGIDLKDLSDTTWQRVEDAFHQYAALTFPSQYLNEAEQVAFAARFGDIEMLREDAKAIQISNKKLDGTFYQPEDFRFKTLRGNEGWHMDSTYMPLAAKAGMLSAIEVPAEAGRLNSRTCGPHTTHWTRPLSIRSLN